MNRRATFFRVLAVHLLLLAVLTTPSLLDSCAWFKEEEVIMDVDLDALPPAPESEEPRETEEEATEEEEEEVRVPATPIPTARPTATPTPTPAPEAEPTPAPAPTATPKPAPTPTPRPQRRLQTAEDIRRRIEREQGAPREDPAPALDPDRLREQLGRDLGLGGRGGTVAGGRRGGGAGAGAVKSELDARLDAAWTQPPGLGGASNLYVDVTVRVERDGRVSSTRILKASGHPAMDASVKDALSRVRRVRAFPPGYDGDGETFEYRFRIN